MKTLPQLIIIGAGGFGREVLAWAEQSAQFGVDWTIRGFIDDNPDALSGKRVPAPWLGTLQDHQPREDEVFICAIGTPRYRKVTSELIAHRGGRFTKLVHRTAVLGHEVSLGDGVILCPYVVVSGYNELGEGVAVNFHSSIDHDARVGAWSQISCHCDLTGHVHVGRGVFLGSHVSIAPGVQVGDDAYLGAGTVVLRNVEAGAKMIGVPARRIE